MVTSHGWTGFSRRLALTLAVLNAVAALGGAVGLATGVLDLGDLSSRLPLGSPVLGGVALALLVAVPQGVTARLLVRDPDAGAAASVTSGALLVGWILLEVLFLRVVAGLQVAYLLLGAVQVVLGLVLVRLLRRTMLRDGSPGTRPPVRHRGGAESAARRRSAQR